MFSRAWAGTVILGVIVMASCGCGGKESAAKPDAGASAPKAKHSVGLRQAVEAAKQSQLAPEPAAAPAPAPAPEPAPAP
jgi:hypothetical protein